jgi:hypothetical protein
LILPTGGNAASIDTPVTRSKMAIQRIARQKLTRQKMGRIAVNLEPGNTKQEYPYEAYQQQL